MHDSGATASADCASANNDPAGRHGDHGCGAGAAPRLAVTIAAKCALLLGLWLLFFRGNHVAVDAGRVAAAFNFSATAAGSAGAASGVPHGQ